MANQDDQILPVMRSKQVAKRSYDRMSRWYDALASSSEWRYTRRGLAMLNPQPGERVLEIGFGTGNALLALGKRVGPSGLVAGIDISEGMLKVALRKLERAKIESRVMLECGDGADLPYDENEFNAIFMSFTLELFDTPEIPVVLQGCHRVLSGNGRLVVVAMVQHGKDNLAVRMYKWAHQKLPAYVDCRPILLRPALKDAGFKLEEISEHSMWGLPVEIVLGRKQS
jgi:demethylmenaquinone methyltransferase/2-methoxy-6-polyprenyl-1,4-benzoquinol methylase